MTNILKINQNNTTYTYTIIKEGFYPLNNILKYTFSRSGDNTNYKIPDKYLIHASWGRGTSRHTVKCEINYVHTIPIFKISFGESFQTCLESAKSATNVKKNPNKKVRFSGVYIFGLNSQELERERERKYQSCFLKPFNKLGNLMKVKRARKFGEHVFNSFNNIVTNCFYPGDNPVLQEIHFKVQDKNFQINFEDRDFEKENKKK
ncbi:hypothetical protein Glove_27g69 [Diversispora epigaea]|uniref:Uncharacterized protein n=1 Tax=Diversispora epigaea TaxID=1348612 RepID=A0A397JHZ0_9GLOM|nr:hypothetical protein Glove_27g69 [Diversispora epigaea]